MITQCPDCGKVYDDTNRWTICPHGPLHAPAKAYGSKHDLAPCPLCDSTATNPLFRPAEEMQHIPAKLITEEDDNPVQSLPRSGRELEMWEDAQASPDPPWTIQEDFFDEGD